MRKVTFLNPRRPARPFCDGFDLNERRQKSGVEQTLILFPLPTPKYPNGQKIWVDVDKVFKPC